MPSSALPLPQTPQAFQSPVSPPISYLSSRRPSQQTPTEENISQRTTPTRLCETRDDGSAGGGHELAEEEMRLKNGFQIDVKSMVGESVGNVSHICLKNRRPGR